jgi:hypothetical protein
MVQFQPNCFVVVLDSKGHGKPLSSHHLISFYFLLLTLRHEKLLCSNSVLVIISFLLFIVLCLAQSSHSDSNHNVAGQGHHNYISKLCLPFSG